MTENDEGPEGPGENLREFFRRTEDLFPTLSLEVDDPGAARFTILHPTHDLYPLAAWAFHHAEDLPPDVRHGFYETLACVWPIRGRPKSPERGRVIGALRAAKVPADLIAQHWHLTRAHIEDIARDAWREYQYAAGEYRVRADQFQRGLATPPDPSQPGGMGWLSLRQTTDFSQPDYRLGNELAQALGYDSLWTLVKLGYPHPVPRMQQPFMPWASPAHPTDRPEAGGVERSEDQDAGGDL